MENKKDLEGIKIRCKECGRPWTITEGEVTWYQEKGFELPKRCYLCRKKAKERG
ncbi:MAG: zinc-ribbon domain containing protein [Clostridia bacterium]